MLANKDFYSNCKRIAKAIMKDAFSSPTSDAVLFGSVSIQVSENLLGDFNCIKENKQKSNELYEQEINKHLKHCRIKTNTCGFDGSGFYLAFNIEFED